MILRRGWGFQSLRALVVYRSTEYPKDPSDLLERLTDKNSIEQSTRRVRSEETEDKKEQRTQTKKDISVVQRVTCCIWTITITIAITTATAITTTTPTTTAVATATGVNTDTATTTAIATAITTA